jgi:hypothetical protein
VPTTDSCTAANDVHELQRLITSSVRASRPERPTIEDIDKATLANGLAVFASYSAQDVHRRPSHRGCRSVIPHLISTDFNHPLLSGAIPIWKAAADDLEGQ